jgi:RHS repeat-associated protein
MDSHNIRTFRIKWIKPMNKLKHFYFLSLLAAAGSVAFASAPPNEFGYPVCYTNGNLAGGADNATYLDKIKSFLMNPFGIFTPGVVLEFGEYGAPSPDLSGDSGGVGGRGSGNSYIIWAGENGPETRYYGQNGSPMTQNEYNWANEEWLNAASSYVDFRNFSLVGGLLQLGEAVWDPVSVVNGAYLSSDNDLTVSGPIPLTVSRFYSSIALEANGDIGGVWDFNHNASLSVSASVETLSSGVNLPNDAVVTLLDDGSPLVFGRSASTELNVLTVNGGTNALGKLDGVNNYNSRGIGAGASLWNTKLTYVPNSRTFTESNGAGHKRVFKWTSVTNLNGTGSTNKFLLQYEQAPNGTKTLYTYDQYGLRQQLRLTDSSETVIYNWIKFEYDYGYRIKALVARDGRRVEYIYDEFGDLVKVVHPDNTVVTYEYEHIRTTDGLAVISTHRLLRMNKPEGRSLINEYYRIGDVVNGVSLTIGDFRIGRVKLQKAPVAESVKPVTNARFSYEKNTDGSGATDIYDILGNRTHYEYNAGKLLTKIVKYTKTGNGGAEPLLNLDTFAYIPYSIERRIWDSKGNLLAKVVEANEDTNADGTNDLLSCWTATYDESDNLLAETVWGNISGTCAAFAMVNELGEVINTNAVESAVTRYTYSNDGLNLRTSMTDPSGRITRYVYNPKGQMAASYVCGPDSTPLTPFDNPIVTRTFYEYDQNGALLSTLADDGTVSNIVDTTGVTERSRIEITPGTSWPTYGQPKTVLKQYWNGSGWTTLTQTEIGYNTQGWPIKETVYDAEGTQLSTTSRTYDFMGRVLQSTDADSHTTRNTYDFNGNPVAQDGPRTDISDTKTVKYDFFDRPVSESVNVGDGTVLTSTTVYDGYGNKTSQTDHFGNTTHFYYDDLHRLTNTVMPSVSGPDQTVLTPKTSQRYDILDRVVETVDARGGVTLTDYTVFGKPVMITYPDQTSKLFEYNPDGSLAKETVSTGNYVRYLYDSMGRTRKVSSYTAGNKLISSAESIYDALHLRSVTQVNGDTLHYFYDQAGRQNRIEGPESKKETLYDTAGRVEEERVWYSDTGWVCTKTGYSPGGKTLWTSVQKPDGNEQRVTGYAYDEAGNRVVQKAGARTGEPGGETTYYRYNALNQLVSTEIQSAIGNLKSTIVYDYSGNNLVTTAADPLTNKTITVADALGRTRTVLKKNASGQLLHQTDYIYNAAGDILEQTDRVQSAPGNLKHATTLKWTYDEASHSGRKASFTRAAESTSEQRTETYHYDEWGRLFYTAYPGGLQIFNYYDDAQRLKHLFSSDGTVRYQYTYDSAGRLDTVMDEINNVKVDRTYGIENRLLSETLSTSNISHSTISYAYDRSGRPTRLRLDNNTAVDYAYDGVNLSAVKRMSGVTAINSQGVVNYQHVYTARDAMGRIMSSTLADGSTQTITRDILGRSTSITTPWWSWAVDSQNGYDPVGNLRAYTAVDPVGTLSYTNGYDSLYHLTNHHSSVANQKFSYDSIGNRLTGPSVFASAVFNYTYNRRNELQSRTDPNGTLGGTITVPVRGLAKPNPYTSNAVTAVTVRLDSNAVITAQLTGEEWEVAGGGISVPVDGTNHTLLIAATDQGGKTNSRTLTLNYNASASSSYVYDLRGNLVQKTVHTNPLQITSYTYDALNRLLSVSSVSSVVQYRYDYLNRRVAKTVTTGTGGSSSTSTEYYLWSGQSEIGAFDADLNLIQFRMLGEGLGAEVGAAVAVELRDGVSNPWKTYVPVHDFRGNVVCLVDKLAGTVAESYRYDAYGNVKIYDSTQSEIANHQTAIGNPWQFSSKRMDREVGLIYFTQRYYDPTLGRFVTTDPLGATDGVNMYGYVHANPMMFVDPTGLLAKHPIDTGENILKNTLAHGVGAGWAVYNSFVDMSDTWKKDKGLLINPFQKEFSIYEIATGGFHAAGVLAGAPASFLSGDIYHNYGSIMDGAKNLAISGMDLSGGFYTEGYAGDLANKIEHQIGQPVAAITNPSLVFGFGSIVHSLLGELGVTFTPSVYVAMAIRGGVENLYAHSQGTLVVLGASGLISDSQRNQLNMQTFGGEIQWDTATWGFKQVVNNVNAFDAVPRLSPLNMFGGAWAGLYNPFTQGIEQHKLDLYIDKAKPF